jgi:hypothetical protein
MKMFLIRRWIDGAFYGGRIPAHDWAEAEAMCEEIGLTLDGEFVPGGVAEGRDRSMLVTTEEAFKQGAEAVRERAVAKMDAMRASFGTDEFAVGGDVHAQIIAGMCADAIRALPLTEKE